MAQLINPEEKRPIVIIGAGSIVNIAHLPAYDLAGFEVAGIFDLDNNKAEANAKKFGVPVV
jgi:predicted dehydrogenase